MLPRVGAAVLLLSSLALAQATEDEARPSPADELDAGAPDASGADQPKDPLVAAVLGGDLAAVRRLLKAGSSPDAVGRLDKPVLLIALEEGHGEVARALLDAGASLRRTHPNHPSLVYKALAHDLRELALLLLERGASADPPVNAPDLSVLRLAAERGDLELVRALLARQVPVDELSLEAAVTGKSLELLGALLTKVKDKAQLAPALVRAVDRKQLDAARLLLKAGAPADVKMMGLVARALSDKQPELAALLLEHGADPSRPLLSGGPPPLHLAARAGDVGAVKLLLKKGASPNEWEPRYGTALSAAFDGEQQAAADVLIAAGASLNLPGYRGTTPLVHALAHKHPQVDRWLKKGVNPNATAKGPSPLHLAIEAGQSGLVRALLAAGADPDLVSLGMPPLVVAAGTNQLEAARALLEAGARAEASAQNGQTALAVARARNASAMVELLSQAQSSAKAADNLPGLNLSWRPPEQLLSQWKPWAWESAASGAACELTSEDGKLGVRVEAWTTTANCARAVEAVARSTQGCSAVRGKGWPGLEPLGVKCQAEQGPAWSGCLTIPGGVLLVSAPARGELPKADEQSVGALLQSLAAAAKARPPPIPTAAPRLPHSGLVVRLPRGGEEWFLSEESEPDEGRLWELLVRALPAKPALSLGVRVSHSGSCSGADPSAAAPEEWPSWLSRRWRIEHSRQAKGALELTLCAPAPKGAVFVRLRGAGPLSARDEGSVEALLRSIADSAGLERKPLSAEANGTFTLPATGLTYKPTPGVQLQVSSGWTSPFHLEDLGHARVDVLTAGPPVTLELGLALAPKPPHGKAAPASCDEAMKRLATGKTELQPLGTPGWHPQKRVGTNDDGQPLSIACRSSTKGPVLAISVGRQSEQMPLFSTLSGLEVPSAPAASPSAGSPARQADLPSSAAPDQVLVYAKSWRAKDPAFEPFKNAQSSMYYAPSGNLVLETYHDDTRWQYLVDRGPGLHGKDFVIEAELRLRSNTAKWEAVGLVYGVSETSFDDLHTLWFDSKGQFAFSRRVRAQDTNPIPWRFPARRAPPGSGVFRLTVKRTQGFDNFYVNSTFLAKTPASPLGGARLGLLAGGRASVEVLSFKVSAGPPYPRR